MRRRFSASERTALYFASSGLCSICGVQLEPSWHADHVIPFWLSGVTDVASGQALCPPCNLRKGGRIVPENTQYHWQDNLLAKYLAQRDPEDFLLVACPGAGKTRGSLRLAKELLDSRVVRRIIVVAPTVTVKSQWQEAAHILGISLDSSWTELPIPSDMDGITVTYAAVSRNPLSFRIASSQIPTLVIFDEIHHATEDADWGDKMTEAFGAAKRRLMLSGTPYHPTRKISFLTYDPEGYAEPDFEFLYREAVTNQTCRSVFFPRTGGETEWTEGDVAKHANFRDVVDRQAASRRLNTAIYADYDSISPIAEQMLREADRQLSEARGADGTAGGLILAKGKEMGERRRHADCIASHMERITGRRPVVVVSDDPGSQARIKAFRNSTERWLVSIQMVAEGVDIPRLQVLCYLSNVTSQLRFDQAVGRIARGRGNAYFHIPDDRRLLVNALRIMDERKMALRETQKNATDLITEVDLDAEEPSISRYGYVGSTPEEAGCIAPDLDGDALFGVYRIDQAEYADARKKLQEFWPTEFVPHDVVARFVLEEKRNSGEDQNPNPLDGSLMEQKKSLKDAMNRIVKQYCITEGLDFAIVNATLNRSVGIEKLKHATLAQLQARMREIEKLTS